MPLTGDFRKADLTPLQRLLALTVCCPWGMAVVLVLLGLAVRTLLHPLFGSNPAPSLMGWPISLAIVMTCGLPQALVAVAVFGFVGWYVWLDGAVTVPALFSVGTFAVLCTFNVVLVWFLAHYHERELKRRKDQLEADVKVRTDEKDRLVRVVNHKVGNNLQIVLSFIEIELRREPNYETEEVLTQLRDIVRDMGTEHARRSMEDYRTDGELAIGAHRGGVFQMGASA